jgi:nitrous oxide reductase accessory protein NosL
MPATSVARRTGDLVDRDEPGRERHQVRMNDMGPRWQNPRTRALVDAVYACLA